MFRNSIKELDEPSLEDAALPRRDSLSRLHDAIENSSMDGHVRVYMCQTRLNYSIETNVQETYRKMFFLILN